MDFRQIAISYNQRLQFLFGKWSPLVLVVRKQLEVSGFKLMIHGGTAIELKTLLNTRRSTITSNDLDLIIFAYTHATPELAIDRLAEILPKSTIGTPPFKILKGTESWDSHSIVASH